jgi:hypothetical protein
VRIDLLLVIEKLGICFHWWWRTLSHLDGCLLRSARGVSTGVSTSISTGVSAGISAGVSAAITTRPTMGTAVRALSDLRHFPSFTFNLGERGSDEFTIAHLFLTSKDLQKIKTGSKILPRAMHIWRG